MPPPRRGRLTIESVRWLVGLDLRPAGDGALAFARWLTARVPTPGAHELVCIHAIEGWELLLSRGQTEQALDDFARAAVDATVERAGLPAETVRVVHGSTPDEALAAAVARHRADAVLVGRRSPMDGDEIVRLGRVARRLLRRLPVPVVVVPADLRSETVGTGPIVVAATADGSCDAAPVFARELQARIDRPIHVLAVVPPAFPPGVSYLPTPHYDPQIRLRRESDLRTWRQDHGLASASLEVLEGPVIPTLLARAGELDACILVTGSRNLSRTQRVFQSSVGSTVAASARCPVAVVPRETP